ncbi:MAG: hypothetical protein ACRERU_14460 [Methylococcales bacterium]
MNQSDEELLRLYRAVQERVAGFFGGIAGFGGSEPAPDSPQVAQQAHDLRGFTGRMNTAAGSLLYGLPTGEGRSGQIGPGTRTKTGFMYPVAGSLADSRGINGPVVDAIFDSPYRVPDGTQRRRRDFALGAGLNLLNQPRPQPPQLDRPPDPVEHFPGRRPSPFEIIEYYRQLSQPGARSRGALNGPR